VERREDILAEAEVPIRRLDLVQPLVHEALLGVDGRRVAPPRVGHDRAEAGTVGLRAGSDRATPAAQLEAAVRWPHADDRVPSSGPGKAVELRPAVARTQPCPPAGLGQRTDGAIDHDDLEGVDARGSLAPGLDCSRYAVENVERCLQLVRLDLPLDPMGPAAPAPASVNRAIDQGQCSPDLGSQRGSSSHASTSSTRSRINGRWTVNAVCSPRTLSTEISPPCCSTMWRVPARPTPVPFVEVATFVPR
jgi:hypothetical protein